LFEIFFGVCVSLPDSAHFVGMVVIVRECGMDRPDRNIERVGDIDSLGYSATDRAIAAYAGETDRLILTQDNDFFTDLTVEDTAGVLFQKEKTLSGREVGDIVHEMFQYLDQERIDLEYVSRNWL
jgi:predicted nuclease of predicted toxin-antitoxin system